MLRKMYLVSPDYLNTKADQPPPPLPSKAARMRRVPPLPQQRNNKRSVKADRAQQQAYAKWVKTRANLQEAEFERNRQIKTIADFLKKVLPASVMEQKVMPKLESLQAGTQTDRRPSTSPSPGLYASPHPKAIPSTSGEVTYASTTPPSPVIKTGSDDDVDDDNDDDDTYIDKDVLEFGKENFGEVATPYVSPYAYKRGFLDTTYGIRKVGNTFMIGDSPVDVDTDSNVHIKNQEFKGTKGLWELLTRKRVNKGEVKTPDLQQYKRILQLTNAHLEDYNPNADINITRGLKYKEVISKLFPTSRHYGAEKTLRRSWMKWR